MGQTRNLSCHLLGFESNKALSGVQICLWNLKSRLYRYYWKTIKAWLRRVFTDGVEGLNGTFLTQRRGMAAERAVARTALLQYGLNVLTSTPCSDLLVGECQYGVWSRLTFVCLLFVMCKSKAHPTEIMDLTQFWHIPFHLTGEERLRCDS